MSDAPQLPEGDDPWGLLGIARDADARTVKRAYTRLIRTFKPERFPAEFQRVRAAYETIRDRAADEHAARGAAPGWDHPESAPETDPPGWTLDSQPSTSAEDQAPPGNIDQRGDAPPNEPPSTPWEFDAPEPGEWRQQPEPIPTQPSPWKRPDVWEAAAEGDLERARALLCERAARPPHPADFAHRFLLEELAGDNEAAAKSLDDALTVEVPIATWARATLDPDTLNRIATRDAFSWSTLRKQPDRVSAAALYHFRSDELLMRGRLGDVVDEVSDRAFRREALDDDQLRLVPVSVASALIWDDVARGIDLFDAFAAEVRRDDSPGFEDVFLHVRRAAEAWNKWDERSRAPDAYRRFLQLRAVVDSGQQRRLARALHGDFLDRPTEYGEFLAQLATADAEIISFHEYALWVHEITDEESGSLVLPEVDETLANGISAAAAAIERDLERAGTNKLSSLVLLAHLVAIVLGFVFLGWWGVLTMAVLFVTGMRLISWFDERLYRRSVRPTLVRLIAEHDIHAAQFLAYVAGTKGPLDEVARFKSEIGDDPSLRHVHILARLRRRT